MENANQGKEFQEDKSLEVSGFVFGTMEDADVAREEIRKIAYIQKRMDYSNTESILALYKKMIDERMFCTPIGLEYLKKMQDLLKRRGVTEDKIVAIPLYVTFSQKFRKNTNPAKQRVWLRQYREERSMLRKSILFNICLTILVFAFFLITLQSDNPNILNYEKNLIDKYAAWEQDLTERENNVKDAERKLNISVPEE